MKCFKAGAFFGCAVAIISLATAARVEAVTSTVNRQVEHDNISMDTDGNRPFFIDNYNDGTTTFTNPEGYTGTATPGVDGVTTVMGLGINVGGDGGNGLPMGVGISFDVSFTVQTTGPNGGVLTDNGSTGLGVDSAVASDNATQLTAGEQLLFSNITITNVSFQDPLGLFQPGATAGNAKWTALRSNGHGTGDAATTSSDAAATQDVTTFNTATSIENNYGAGLISPGVGGLSGPLYLTTTTGNWPLKGIRYTVEVNYEPSPVPATRRTFLFPDSETTPVYDGLTTHQITDDDTTITINAVGTSAVFDTNSNGVGILSAKDSGRGDAAARRIDGSSPDAESIQFSFNQDVSLESLTIGSLNLEGNEGVKLSYVSGGTNPFTGLTGYAGDYALAADSLTFTTSGGGITPYLITYGMDGQSPIVITEGTVLSVTADPVHTDAGILLDMITVNLLEEPGLEGDHNGDGVVDAADYVAWRKDPNNNGGDPGGYNAFVENFGESGGGGAGAVPEPSSVALVLLALVGIATRGARRA
jgi:hypothetical protein